MCRNTIADVQFAVLLKQQDRGPCELLGQRGYPEYCAWCVRHVPLFIGGAIAAFEHDLSVDADQNGAAKILCLNLLLKKGVRLRGDILRMDEWNGEANEKCNSGEFCQSGIWHCTIVTGKPHKPRRGRD